MFLVLLYSLYIAVLGIFTTYPNNFHHVPSLFLPCTLTGAARQVAELHYVYPQTCVSCSFSTKAISSLSSITYSADAVSTFVATNSLVVIVSLLW